jgi:hypothetical protein
MHVSRLFLALLLVSTGFVHELFAQDIRGTVRDSASRQPIAGAVVQVLDATGQSLGRSITNDRGEFRVAARAGGRAISVKRIGFRPRLVPTPSATSPIVDIAMVPLASLLDPIQVSDVTKCPRRSDRAAAVALWEQARTGLLATVVSRETNPANVRRLTFRRIIDRDGQLRSQSVGIDSARTDRAFGAALTVAEFRARGFKGDSAGMDAFYGPDADVLLSDEFAAGYCFRIADRDAARPGQIGLAFSPAERSRDRTDIEGTLWVDSIGRRILDIDFAYLGLSPRAMPLHPGGRVSFQTMANGMVVLDRWFIRIAGVSGDSVTIVRDLVATREPLLEIHEQGGEIAHAAWPDGTTWNASLGTVRGRATKDSVPAPGVTVRLEGTDYRAITDSTGAFEIHELLPGPYDLRIQDERLARVGLLLPTGVSFTATRGSTNEVSAPVPSLDDYTWRVCGDDPKRPRAGRPILRMLIVRLLTRDERPVAGSTATVRLRRAGSPIMKSEVTSGDGGRVQLCRVPETATAFNIVVDRVGLPPFEFDGRLTDVLTTMSLRLGVVP